MEDGDKEANSDQNQNLADGIGDCEKHTKGIGAKLLLGMGFQPNKGLGRNLQGRTEIFEAYLRKGREQLEPVVFRCKRHRQRS